MGEFNSEEIVLCPKHMLDSGEAVGVLLEREGLGKTGKLLFHSTASATPSLLGLPLWNGD